MLPFAWLHLFGGRSDGQSLSVAAVERLRADFSLQSPARWLLLAWLLLPLAWFGLGIIYLNTTGPAPSRGKAIALAAMATLLAALATSCYGVGTAPLFFSVPALAAQLAFRLRTVP